MTKNRMASLRDGFGDALLTVGGRDRRVVVLSADLQDSTRAAAFADRWPERFIELGVAEQNMLGVAAGLANEGFIPFCTSFAVFNPGRNWDQLRVSICYNHSNVKIIGSHAGLTNGADGATHQALEDIALTRVLSNLVVLAPADIHETKAATLAAAKYEGPVYIRFGRANEPVVTKAGAKFRIGPATVWAAGTDVTVCTTGSMLQPALAARRTINGRVSCEVIHFPTIKPLDVETLLKSVRKTNRVVTVEEAQLAGGFGSAIAEVLSEQRPTAIHRLGVADSFGASGTPAELRALHHLTADDIAAAIIAARLTTDG